MSIKPVSQRLLPHLLSVCPLVGAIGAMPAMAADAKTGGMAPIVVTASRSAETADEALAAVSVISREQLDNNPGATVNDLLQRLPGLNFGSNGGLGKTSSLFMRGTESDHVLVLVDGVKVGSATTGTTFFDNFPTSEIDHIEVVRGPRSAIYGSEAIGGVVQIFTRKGAKSKGFTPSFSTTIGSEGYREATVSGSARGSLGWVNTSLSGLDWSGYNVTDDNPETDDDGFRRKSALINGGLYVTDQLTVEGLFSRAISRNEYDGFYATPSDFNGDDYSAKIRNDVYSLKADYQVTDDLKLTAQVGRSNSYETDYNHSARDSLLDTRRDSYSTQADWRINSHNHVTFGIDHHRDVVTSATEYTSDHRTDTGVFGVYKLAYGLQDWEFALRQDHYSEFGDKTTGSIAYGYQFSDYLRGYASYGTAFKAPSFNEIYAPRSWGGNLDLKPEKSKNYEIGLKGHGKRVNWQLSAYENQITDLIASDASYNMYNIDEARIRGLEFSANTQLADWQLSGALNVMNPENRKTNKQLLRRPQRTLDLALDQSKGNWSYGANWHLESNRPDTAGRIGGFGTLDLHTAYQVTPSLAVKTRVANLMDKDYQLADGYDMQGRAVYLTLEYQPH